MTVAENLGRGEFFAIDRRSFSRACALGLNAGVIYLTIARGTGSDHCISHWSINAIEQYTGISRPKAIVGLALLIGDGLIVRERAGTKPRYRIVSWQNIVGENVGGSGNQPPEYVWLPNALIDGAAHEKSPISLIREMQDIRRLQLFIAMYDESDLPNEGGVRRLELFAKFICLKIVERGDVTIWGYDPSMPKSAFVPGGSLPKVYGLTGGEEDAALTDFFEGVTSLRQVGLFEFVPHAFESDDQDAEMIHSVCNASGESWEVDVANAAHETAFCYLWPDKQRWVEGAGVRLIPARAHMGRITIMGIARLRYRPRTRKTAAWVSKSKERTAAFLDLYKELQLIAPQELHSSLQHKGVIKGYIKG